MSVLRLRAGLTMRRKLAPFGVAAISNVNSVEIRMLAFKG